MTGPQIKIALSGERHGCVIATMPAPDPYIFAERLVVGDVYRRSADGEPEDWRAWLWPLAGGAVHTTQHCEAVDSSSPVRLRDRLQKRADKEAWWK